jgi:hypothetical protein
MKTAGPETRGPAAGARESWFAWFGLALILFSSSGCRSTGLQDSSRATAGGEVNHTTVVPGPVDLQDRLIDPFKSTRAKAIVFLFVRTDCPISNRYAPEIQRLFKKYGPQGIDFWLVYPDLETQPAEIARHAKEYQLSLRALRDPRHALVQRAEVRVTPEAAVFFRDGRVVYRGPIDDRFADFGKERPSPTRRELEEALLAILHGQPVPTATTRAIGCYIQAIP